MTDAPAPAAKRSRIPVGMLDQLVSSLSNLAITIVVARSSSVNDFGAFALVYLIYGLGLGAIRATGGDVLLLTGHKPGQDLRPLFRALLGSVALLSAAVAVVLVAAAAFLPSSIDGLVLALGVSMPGLLVQDALRYCFFARRQPGSALINDLVWLVIQAALFAFILAGGWPRSPAAFLFAWGIGAYLAAGLGLWQIRLIPAVSGPRRWVSEHRGRIWSFLADYSLMMGASQLAMVLVGVIAGLPAVAGLRVAQLLFLPFHTAFASLRIMLMGGLADAATSGHRVIVRRATLLGGCAGLAATGYAAAALLLPDSAGIAMFGAAWNQAEPLVWALAVVCIARTLSIPVVDSLRALGGGRRLVTIRMANSIVLLGGVCGLAVAYGVTGAAIGLATAATTATVLWWVTLLRADSVAVAAGQRPRDGGDNATIPR